MPRTKKHPRDLTDAELDSIVRAFDEHPDHDYDVVGDDVLRELR